LIVLSDAFARLVRTYVPAGVAWIAGVFALPESWTAEVTTTATAIIFGAYYFLVAFLEEKVNAGFGWLLGFPKERTKY